MITVMAPATSANCSVGFDCLGLALDWKSRISFEKAPENKITGCPQEYCTMDNLVMQAFLFTCQYVGVEPDPVHIHIDSDIPFARGLGSSSQCIVAGILGADAIMNLHLNDEQKLDIATRIEGHPDNVAPALFGGLIACANHNDRILKIKMDGQDWQVLVVIPDYEVSTHEARKVLPSSLDRPDVVRQVSHAMLFEYAWVHQDEDMLKEVCEDYIHEPYRAKLIPDYAAMRQLADQNNVPFWISGSGSTMAFISQDRKKLEAIRQEVESVNPALKCLLHKVCDTGAEVIDG
ncbi:MAG: homoserine kinase [Allobaculum sp.]